MTLKLTLVFVISLVSATAAGALFYVLIPEPDRERKTLLSRSAGVAHQEASARKEAEEKARPLSRPQVLPEPKGGYRQMAPRFE